MTETPTINSRRPVNTCMRCRRLKLKCDHGRPCQGCVKSSTVAECQYTPVQREDRSSPESGYHSPPPERKRRRAVRVCSRCRRLKLRCDQGKPCASCVGAGAVEDGECVYMRWPGEEPKVGSTPQDIQELHQRIKLLESQLASSNQSYLSPDSMSHHSHASQSGTSVPTTHSTASHDPRVPHAQDLDIPTILSLLPPPEDCRRLLKFFLSFDLLFRLVHTPSFLRTAETVIAAIDVAHSQDSPTTSRNLSRVLNLSLGSGAASAINSSANGADSVDSEPVGGLDTSNLPTIALFIAAIVCGSTIAPQYHASPQDARCSEGHLRLMLWTVLSMCDCKYQGVSQIDYVHAHVLSIYTNHAGRGGGPQKCWLACGRAYNAALLCGINKEDRVVNETQFEREMRRRLWWHILQTRHFVADRLRIDVEHENHNVPRPLNLTNAQLDILALNPQATVLPSPRDTLTEWSYVDSKLDVLVLLQRRDKIMSRTDIPLVDRLEAATMIVQEYATARPLHQQGHASVAANLPSWAQMQAHVSDIACAEMKVHLYRPHFGSTEMASEGVSMGAYALARGVQATQELVKCVKALTQNVVFGWLDLDTPIFALWTCGMRGFTAGLVLAFSLIADPENPSAASQMADFEAMIGILRSRRSLPGTAESNERALATLEQLRQIIKAKDHSVHDLLDPYTGRAVDMPLFIPDFAVVEWVEWETLFQDLFHEGNVVPAQ